MPSESADEPVRRELPRGCVSFVVTDIEDSTALLRRLGDAFAAALARHRDLLRRAAARHGGHWVAMQGDGSVCVYADATAAMSACVEAQAAIEGERWPAGARLAVCMGLHTGEAEPLRGTYIGLAVHQAARVCAAGHGGQILLSEATVQTTRDRLPGGCTLRELGRFGLKDFAQPEALHQLCYPGLRSHFALPRTLSTRSHNLPHAATPFIGRSEARARLGQLLRERRIVSVVGPAGVGKTRLALEVGADLLPLFRDGVWRVDLSAVGGVESAARVCADALGVREERGRRLLDSIAAFLESRAALLILDACDQAPAAAARLATALSGAPEARVLATSRIPLRVTGEQLLQLAPLPARDAPETLSQAAQLWVERLRAHCPDLAIDEATAQAVDAICAGLDGLPLALELSASRARIRPVGEIAQDLQERLRRLADNVGELRARQQALRTTIEWSLELLAPDERLLFERLAVFGEGFDRSAAEAVCAGEGLAVAQIDPLLRALVDASLVRYAPDASGEGRFGVTRALRPFAAELRRTVDLMPVQRRLLEWALELARENGSSHPVLVREQDNLRVALELGHRLDLREPTVRLTAALTPFWIECGQWREGVEWTERAERLPEVDRAVRAPLLIGLGRLLRGAEPARAENLLRQALALAVQGDDRACRIEALNQLATLARDRGDFAATESLLREQIAQLAGYDDPRRRFRAETELATLLLQDSRHEEAVAALRERMAEAEANGWRFDRARLSNNLAVGLIELGQHGEALRLATEGADLFRELGSLEGVAHLLSTAGMALMRRGDATQARRHFVEVGRIALEVGAPQLGPEALERLAALEIEDGRERSGARYLYAADALYAAAGYERERADRALRQTLQQRLDAKLDAATLGRIRVDAMMQARSVLTEAIRATP